VGFEGFFSTKREPVKSSRQLEEPTLGNTTPKLSLIHYPLNDRKHGLPACLPACAVATC